VRSLPLAALVAILLVSHAVAQVPPITTTVAGSAANGLQSPVFVCAAPGDLTRLFVVQKNGYIKVRNPVNALTVWGTFLDIHLLVSGGSEQGLLGLAFHPNYQTNGYFFVYYTSLPSPGSLTIMRYQVSANPDVANAGSATPVLSIPHPSFSNHNAGGLYFGPDGMLYIPTGDGGSGNDPNGNAQNINSYLGKILRINVDTLPYTSPATNPFFGPTPGLDEICVVGCRNPWRGSFDRLTGDFWLGDVGQDAREEIDFVPAGTLPGRNFGWRCMEGNQCTGLSGCTCSGPTLTNPVYTYSSAIGVSECTVIGGYVYRGCAIPQLRGYYFFNDYCTSKIWRFTYNGTAVQNFLEVTAQLNAGSSIVSYGEDAFGEMYICNMSGSTIRKIVPVAPQLVGVTSYGTGTAGCNGASVLSLGCSPTLYNPGETIVSTNGPAGTNAIGIIGSASLPVGSDPLGIGVEVLVDLTPTTYTLFEFTVGAGGTTTIPAAIPNALPLVGTTVFLQEYFLWTSCSPSPLNLSSTNALQVTIQP
jgi:glucose/arabinose dehydrogenase